jgi:hypothetical protein
MRDFNSYLQIPSALRKTPGVRRAYLHKKIREAQPAAGYFSSDDSYSLSQTARNILAPALHEPEPQEKPKPRTKTTDGLTYLSRLPECKKLKIWLRPV